ncbi:DUF787 family protein (plasmid) [Borreliella californiensis]|uniref:DUF787 family protein n=1 Tax=Borreliella californiensis TaxID=373543 RepID=A0A7W9ZKZ1_9SPIR|nr:DUF787 family protein [Borreliella californiensis]MBB6213398.1 hypothetical protein [Borreliella californiensis]MBB6213443.1 hypothetical protein [Borreliella californiensis]WKC91303.1 DUF787 family protein [Borreliella californiensis]WNY70963.1 DUF787 family protein [Borreliella californiensis]
MPKDTISISLVQNRLDFNNINYYNPLLIYKSNVLASKHLALSVTNLQDLLEKLEMQKTQESDSSKKKIAEEQISVLKKSMQDFFGQDGLRSVDFYVYNQIKEIKDFLKSNLHPFVVFVNQAEDTISSDFEEIRKVCNFIIISTKDGNLPNFLKGKDKSELKNVIAVYGGGGSQDLHLKFAAVYLHQASIFHAVNPYGMILNSSPIYDDFLIDSLRKSNINFYSLLNETSNDGILAFKEGVSLSGDPIDEAFTLFYIKNEATKELIRVWNKNNRANSKLGALNLDGNLPNEYTAGLECFFHELKQKGLIISYKQIKLKVNSSKGLSLSLEVALKYNDSFNSVNLVITAQEISEYLRRAS